MLHTIQNGHLICTIAAEGAEIRSLIDKKTAQEYIWQIDQNIWQGSSPVLFPAIGKIRKDKITYKGSDYLMTKHGIVRYNDSLEFKQLTTSKCSFTLESTAETFKRYPFHFKFTVSYTLKKKSLFMTYTVQNTDTRPMYFVCGGHTAYALQLDRSTALSDYVIEFPKEVQLSSHTLNASGFRVDKKRPIFLSAQKDLTLTENLFNDDALIFSEIDFDWVRLRKKKDKKGVIVRFTGYPHLALWSKPGADYVCIEPWLGLTDREDEPLEISQKSTYKRLEPATSFSITIETEIE